MVPLAAVLDVKNDSGPYRVVRYNLYPSAELQGDTVPGYSSGQSLSAMEKLAQKILPTGFSYEWTELAYQQKVAGNTELAVATLSATLDRTPDQSPVNAALGRIWLQLAEDGHGRAVLGKALEALERAASALSATSETKALYGRALALAGQLEAAEQVFGQAAERYPVDPSALKQLSTVAEQLGHTDVARSSLMEYVSLRPADRNAAADAARIGMLSLALHDAPGALPWLQRALADNPQDIGVLSALADAQLQTGDAAAARLTLNRAIALDPSSRQVLALDRRIKRAGA